MNRIGYKHRFRCFALPVVFAACQPFGFAATFNAAADFSSVSNPAGNGWSYGYYTIGSPLTLMTVLSHDPTTTLGFDTWQPSSTRLFPDISKNLNPVGFNGCPAGCLSGANGNGSSLSVVRLTNNTSDYYAQVTATFSGYYSGNNPNGLGNQIQTGYILLNGVTWSSNSFTNVGSGFGSITLSGTVLLSPGETIDFGLANGRIVLDARISTLPLPEPGSCWLVFLGISGLTIRYRLLKR